jgi:phage anti-repressor protein
MGSHRISVVDARDLHQVLGVGRAFATWITDRIEEFGFVEGKDYKVVNIASQNGEASFDFPKRGNQTGRGGDRRTKDYRISLYMAQHLSMVERTPKGKQVRDYFLEVERLYMDRLQSLSAIPYNTVPEDCTTRPLIKDRSQLSFRSVDEAGNAIMALEDSRAAWDVPRGLSFDKSKKTGQAYFAELQELAENNLEEAKSALIELFLFGWRTPMETSPLKTTEQVFVGGGQSVQVLTKDSLVHPDVVGDCGVEWSFLETLAHAALGQGN